MHKFFADKITQAPLNINQLEVQSFEMNVYLVKLTVGNQTGMVFSRGGHIKRFNSMSHIREFFSHCDIDAAHLTHDSPYDEMIGNPPKATQSAVMPLNI